MFFKYKVSKGELMEAQPRATASPSLPVLALTCLAGFMVTLDALVVITALPAIHQSLAASLDTLQWTVNAYSLAFAAGIIPAAVAADRFGRRRLFALGLVLFAAASAACALASNGAVLISARTVQGLAGALVAP